MNKMKLLKILMSILGILFCMIIIISNTDQDITKEVSSNTSLSNKKIGWGVKRNDNHLQPDLGTANIELTNKYNGIAMGNKDKNYVYLTFDEGYEAGYTEKILDVLKANEVKAVFFITGHYLNTADNIVKRMIDEGHIVGNQSPHTLMEL